MRKIALMTLVLMFVGAGAAFAFQTAQPAAPAAGGAPQIPVRLGGGLLAGIVAGVIGAFGTVSVGLLKSKNMETGAQEAFDVSKAWETLLVGAVVGLVAGLLRVAPADAMSFLTTSPIGAGLVAFAEMSWNAFYRQTAALVKKALAHFRAPKA